MNRTKCFACQHLKVLILPPTQWISVEAWERLLMTGGQKMHQGGSFTPCLQTSYFLDLHSSSQHFAIHGRKYLPRQLTRKEAAIHV